MMRTSGQDRRGCAVWQKDVQFCVALAAADRVQAAPVVLPETTAETTFYLALFPSGQSVNLQEITHVNTILAESAGPAIVPLVSILVMSQMSQMSPMLACFRQHYPITPVTSDFYSHL